MTDLIVRTEDQHALLTELSAKLDAAVTRSFTVKPDAEMTVVVRADEVVLLQLAIDAARWKLTPDKSFAETVFGWLSNDVIARVQRRRRAARWQALDTPAE